MRQRALNSYPQECQSPVTPWGGRDVLKTRELCFISRCLTSSNRCLTSSNKKLLIRGRVSLKKLEPQWFDPFGKPWAQRVQLMFRAFCTELHDAKPIAGLFPACVAQHGRGTHVTCFRWVAEVGAEDSTCFGTPGLGERATAVFSIHRWSIKGYIRQRNLEHTCLLSWVHCKL